MSGSEAVMHDVNPHAYDAAAQWFMAGAYVVNLWLALIMLLALVRVVRIKLPFHYEKYEGLYIGQGFSPRLYSWSGRVKKAFKVSVLALVFLVGLGGWLVMVYFTWKPAYKWAGWGLAPDSAIAGVHLGVGATLLVLMIVRGIRSVRPQGD